MLPRHFPRPLFRQTVLPALVPMAVCLVACTSIMNASALAQSPSLVPDSGTPQATAQPNADDSSQDARRLIRDRLAEEGFKDIRVEPGSYIVIAKDKHDRAVMMMIGPNSTTMFTAPDSGDSTAQLPDTKDEPVPQ